MQWLGWAHRVFGTAALTEVNDGRQDEQAPCGQQWAEADLRAQERRAAFEAHKQKRRHRLTKPQGRDPGLKRALAA